MKRTKQSQPRRRCRKCGGRRQRGKGGKRKADALAENLAGMRAKKARGDMTEEEYSKDRKALLETESGQTGAPMDIQGDEIKQHYGRKIVTARRRNAAENDLQLYEMQRAILGPTHTEEAFMERKKTSATWPTQPPAGVDPTITDWRTVPGYPKLPTNVQGQVTLDQSQVASDYSLMRAPGALKSVINKVISALGVTRSVGYKAATFALKNPLVILQYGAAGVLMYKTWDYWGPIVRGVFAVLGWLGNAGARANVRGSSYMRNNYHDLPPFVTSSTGTAYTELPSVAQVLTKVASDVIPTVLQNALADPETKANVQAVLEATVEVARERPGLFEGVARDVLYGASAAPEMLSTAFNFGKSLFGQGQLGQGRVFVHDLMYRGF